MQMWYVCFWRPEFSIRSLSPLLSMLFFETGSLIEPGARMGASNLHLPIFVPPPVLGLQECRATPVFLFWCWGPELGFSCLHSQLSYLQRHLSLSSFSCSLLFRLLEEGPRISPLLGRHCPTEPYPQLSLPLFSFRCLSL